MCSSRRKVKPVEVPPIPDFSLSVDYLVQTFNHYFVRIIVEYGPLDALLFVCVLIMICVVLANTFRYLERVMATKIRVDLVKNMRMDIFRNISLLHIGFFNCRAQRRSYLAVYQRCSGSGERQ